jgi:uncharacterized protein
MRSFSKYLMFSVMVMIFVAMGITGCGTTPSVRYYTLNSTKFVNGNTTSQEPIQKCIVAVGPVEIPDYLERPHIVVKSGQNETSLAEYDRWAGSLRQDIGRVLVENLSGYLPAHISVLSWRRTIPSDYRITVEFTRFDIVPGQHIAANVQWAVYGKDQKTPVGLKNKKYTEPVGQGRNYDTIVTSMSKILGQLSEDLGKDVLKISGK